ncbi:MAG: ABC transporter ATP-binding protein [Euryarchaeota archaeon]|nr:ABC transporter ATP-binding protein [Euryarchaeota archaeon]
MPLVELKNVSKRFGKVVASSNINLRIEDGEYITILGPSGCGKTTLIRMIAGILEPSEGQVLIDGKDMIGTPIEERDIGYVFQNIALFPHLNALENVSYGPIVKNLTEGERHNVSNQYLNLVNLLDRMKMFPSDLSGGEQQKVALARTLASGSKLLLLDEPLSALDARVRVDLRYELRRITKNLGLTVLHVTHDQEEAMTVSDRIVLMRRGRIVESDTPEMMYRAPKELFTANFIGETNLLDGVVVSSGIERSLIELRDGSIVEAQPGEFDPGDLVVISVRPENVRATDEGLNSTIRSISFMGTYLRITAEADSEDILGFDVHVARGMDFNVGDTVSLGWVMESALVYPKPPGGIAEAVKLE